MRPKKIDTQVKLFLIVSCICSLVTGFIVVGIYIYLELQADLWFIIPIAFVLGFFVPPIAYVFEKIFGWL